MGAVCEAFRRDCLKGQPWEDFNMSLETILIIVVVVLLLGGGGWYWRGRG